MNNLRSDNNQTKSLIRVTIHGGTAITGEFININRRMRRGDTVIV